MDAKYWDVLAELTDLQVLALAAGGALLSHLYFNRFQPLLGSSFRFAVACSIAFVSTLVTCTPRTYSEINLLYWKSAAVYLTTLFSSIGAYRLFFHPLGHIPGDTFPALSKWWAMKQAITGHLAYTGKEMHDRLGPVIRLGPNWIDFQNAALIPKIYGANPVQLRKGAWYDYGIGPDYDALQHIKDDHRHAQRRKIWDHGFSMKAISEYESDIQHRITQLVDGVARAARESPSGEVDMELWSSFFSFDVMGDLGFGEGFHMLENGKPHRFLHLLKEAMRLTPPFSQTSWIVPLLHRLPTHPLEKEFRKFTSAQVSKRILQGSKRRDLYSWLLAENGDHTRQLSQMQLNSDAILVVVAGSDTTSSVLTWAWYYLTTNPQCYKKLQAEIDADAEDGKALDPTRLSKLPYLNAVINESMRMQPPVPGGLQRLVPKGGMVLDGLFVPEGTTVSVSAYVVQHDPANWAPYPDKFRPERWIDSDKEIAANKNAFLPFSYGPRSCPGKALALMETRLVLAALVPRYDPQLVPGFDRTKFEQGVRDCFTIQNLPLPLIMVPRGQNAGKA